MEIPLIRISPENCLTIALLSGFAYIGVVGATKLLAFVKTKTGN